MFEEIFSDIGKFLDMARNIVIAVFIVFLIFSELFSKKRAKKPSIFYMLLVVALFAYLPSSVSFIKNFSFNISNFNWWLTFINTLGIPIYTIILIIKR